jgi:hypothetical protein
MSENLSPKPWFRPKAMGGGWTPATWQGWLITAAFVLLIVTTVQMVVPEDGRIALALPWLAEVRRALGVPATGLGPMGVLAPVGLEVAGLIAVSWWFSRSTKPLD